MARKTKARATTRWENEGGEIETAASKSKASAAPTRPRGGETGKKSSASAKPSEGEAPKQKRAKAGGKPQVMASTKIGSPQQKRAKTAAKHSRQEEAGLLSRRIGQVSASGNRAQAKRDSKH